MAGLRKAPEIVALNDDWADFDLNRVSLEELEQRFELSVAFPPIVDQCQPNCTGCDLVACCGCNSN